MTRASETTATSMTMHSASVLPLPPLVFVLEPVEVPTTVVVWVCAAAVDECVKFRGTTPSGDAGPSGMLVLLVPLVGLVVLTANGWMTAVAATEEVLTSFTLCECRLRVVIVVMKVLTMIPQSSPEDVVLVGITVTVTIGVDVHGVADEFEAATSEEETAGTTVTVTIGVDVHGAVDDDVALVDPECVMPATDPVVVVTTVEVLVSDSTELAGGVTTSVTVLQGVETVEVPASVYVKVVL